LDENADAFAAQSAWHERNGHPLAEIMCAPAGSSWNAWTGTKGRPAMSPIRRNS